MQIKPLQIRTFAKLGMERSFFGMAMPEVVAAHPDVYVVTADLCGYSGMDRLLKAHPEAVVNVGIQEQNMLGIACGLALEGKTVFAGSYSAFAVARAMEQVRNHMSVLDLNIKLVGYNAGFAKGALGRSHWATEDVALTRCLPNLTVVVPADATEAVKACPAAAAHGGPCYIRLSGSANCPPVYREDYDFQIGRAIRLRRGTDTAIFANGLAVGEALQAAELLEQDGISAEVINMHTVKPLDTEAIETAVCAYRHVFTAEEHTVIGGLGSAVAEWMAEHPHNCTLHRIGMQDTILKIGSPDYMRRQAGLSADCIAARIKTELEERNE